MSEYNNKIKLRSFKTGEHINEKRDGPYLDFGYLSLFSDPLDWQNGAKEKKYCNYRIVNTKTSIIQTVPKI